MVGEDYFKKGKRAFIIGDHRKSIEMFSMCLEKEYEEVLALLSRGAAFLVTQEYAGALKDFNSVLEIDRNNERAYYYRGITRLKLCQYQAAVEDLSVSLFLNPERAAALFARGVAWKGLDREDLADEDFNKAISSAHTETERFLKIFGSDPNGFERSNALLQSENGPFASLFNDAEIERLKGWMEQ